MDETRWNRRTTLSLIASGAALALFRATGARAEPNAPKTPQPAASPVAPARGHGAATPAPLPFDPTKLKGLSERLLVSHHDNNYAGAVKNLNAVEEQLRGLAKDAPGFLVSALREKQLMFSNSVFLHEAYFGNLGGDGKAAGTVHKALGEVFGTFAHFEETFRATAMSLAGGSGWAVLELNFRNGELSVYASANHTQALAFGCPLLVVDMYEHAYHLDYGAAAAGYVDACFANLRWDEVNRRYERALRMRKAFEK